MAVPPLLQTRRARLAKIMRRLAWIRRQLARIRWRLAKIGRRLAKIGRQLARIGWRLAFTDLEHIRSLRMAVTPQPLTPQIQWVPLYGLGGWI